MKVLPKEGTGNSLLLTYIGDDKDRKFDILIEGVKIATEDFYSVPSKIHYVLKN